MHEKWNHERVNVSTISLSEVLFNGFQYEALNIKILQILSVGKKEIFPGLDLHCSLIFPCFPPLVIS